MTSTLDTSLPYWASVREMEREILAAAPRIKEQPIAEGVVFITAISGAQMTPGQLTECSLRIAAQRCVERVARISTESEILQYRQEHERRKQTLQTQALTDAGKKMLVFSVPPAVQKEAE